MSSGKKQACSVRERVHAHDSEAKSPMLSGKERIRMDQNGTVAAECTLCPALGVCLHGFVR